MPITTIPALGQYGLVTDQPAQELPPNGISGAANVRFRNGSAERFAGHASIFTAPSVTPYFVAPYGTSTARYWIHSGIASTFADDGTTRTDITGSAFTGAIDDRFTGGALHGLFVLNNGVDQPKYWDGNTANNLATLTAWDATWRVKFIRPFRNYLVYGYPTKSGAAYPHTVGWSAAADPGTLPTTYDPASTTTDAGDVPLGETPDVLVDGLPLGEIFVIYKEQSMYRMEYIGGQQIFSFKRIPGNYGMLARGCAAVTPKGHVVLANGDVVLVDGFGEPQSLMVGRLRDTFFQTQLDSTYYARSFVAANPAKSEVWVCYPSVGSSTPDKAWVWNWIDNTWSPRDLPNCTHAAAGLLYYPAGSSYDAFVGSYDEAAGAYDSNDFTPSDARFIMASTAPALYLADSGNKYGEAIIPAQIERTGLVFGDTDTVKTWISMTPRIAAAAGTVVYIQFGGSMTTDVEPTWGTPIAFTVGTDFKAYGFATGRYLAYRIYSTGAQGWSVKSIDCDVKPMGKF
jgi:hypothetical protein